jgi:DNA polymerase zeta
MEMPKRNYSLDFLHTQKKYKTIDQYYAPKNCICCKSSSSSDLCHKCSNNMQNTTAILMNRIRDSEEKLKTLHEICRSCSSYHTIPESHIPCISHDCPTFYALHKNSVQIKRNHHYTKITSIDW